MAAGKSTVAQLLAERFPRAVHVRGDVFRRFVVAGRVEPTPDMPEEARSQLMLRYQLAVSTADAYARANFVAVVQDVIIGPVLADVVERIHTRPRYVIALDPEPKVIVERERTRTKAGYVDGWEVAQLATEFRQTTPRMGLWVNSSDQEPQDTVRAILDHLDEARIDGASLPGSPFQAWVAGSRHADLPRP